MTKALYIVLVILYLVILGVWCYRFPISYKLTTGINSNLILIGRDLTFEERRATEEAFQIRTTISDVLLYSSLAVSIVSFLLIRTNSRRPKLIKPIMILSIIIAVVLLLVEGVKFIPVPPIR
jgi:hypothetical protein